MTSVPIRSTFSSAPPTGPMAAPAAPTCELDCGGGGWLPRGDGCFFLANYTGGLHIHPCYLPFGSLPPIFLASCFGCLLGLLILFWQCNKQQPSESTAGLSSPTKAMDYDSISAAAVS